MKELLELYQDYKIDYAQFGMNKNFAQWLRDDLNYTDDDIIYLFEEIKPWKNPPSHPPNAQKP